MATALNLRANYSPDNGCWLIRIGDLVSEATPKQFSEMVKEIKTINVKDSACVGFRLAGTNPINVVMKDVKKITWEHIKAYFIKCDDSLKYLRKNRPQDGQNKIGE